MKNKYPLLVLLVIVVGVLTAIFQWERVNEREVSSFSGFGFKPRVPSSQVGDGSDFAVGGASSGLPSLRSSSSECEVPVVDDVGVDSGVLVSSHELGGVEQVAVSEQTAVSSYLDESEGNGESESKTVSTVAQHHIEQGVYPTEAFTLHLGAATLQGDSGSVKKGVNLSITALQASDLPRLNPGMVNVTAGCAGYRFLPHGSVFDKPLRLSIGYDSTKIPKGHYAQEIRTYYYDEVRKSWVALYRDVVNKEGREIGSRTEHFAGEHEVGLVYSWTTHFTDMINAIVKAPEMPETQEFTPTSLKELQAADPSSGIQVIQPPTANSQGTASLSYPINVPAGRQGLQPNLAVTYSSDGGNGLLGMGWDMQIPAITVDNKWGVPRYDDTYETETYLYNGEELLPSARLEGFNTSRVSAGGNKVFYPRVEGSFERIVRKGNNPSEYYWIVTDKQGTKYYYGTYDTTQYDSSVLLMDASGHIAHWPLCKVVDINGNTMQYCYKIRTQFSEHQDSTMSSPDAGGIYLGKQLWLDAISYTGNETTGDKGSYKVVFSSFDCDLDSARRVGCEITSGSTRSDVGSLNMGSRVGDSLSMEKGVLLSGRGGGSPPLPNPPWENTHKEDHNNPSGEPEDLQYPNHPDEPEEPNTPCDEGNRTISVEVCLYDICKTIGNWQGASLYFGTTPPEFADNPAHSQNSQDSPYPVHFIPPSDYTLVNFGGAACVQFRVCPITKYYVVVNPPSSCNGGNPITFSFKAESPSQASVSEENSISIIGAHVETSYSTRGISFTIPIRCDCNPGQEPCYDCFGGPCISCPPMPIVCREMVYVGVQDDFCKRDRLPNCKFDLIWLKYPNRVYSYTTGYTRIQPLEVRRESEENMGCASEQDAWYRVKGTYFGKGYQSDTIQFDFRIDQQGDVTIGGVLGIDPSAEVRANYNLQQQIHQQIIDRIIVNKYNNGHIEILMPVLPNPRLARLRVVEQNNVNVGVANYSFLLGNAGDYGDVSNPCPQCVAGIFTTDGQGYTPAMSLPEGIIYHISEVDASSNISIGIPPYTQFIPYGWQNLIELELINYGCTVYHNFNVSTPPLPPTPFPIDSWCGPSICTYVYEEPYRVITKNIRVKKVGTDGSVIGDAVFSVTNNGTATKYVTGADGQTPLIPITSGQTYVLQETKVPPVYLLDNTPITISMDKNGTISIQSTMGYTYHPHDSMIIITNRINCPDAFVQVRKQDADNKDLLKGAVISFYKLGGNDKTFLFSTTTDVYGLTESKTIECDATYYIEESRVPDGYKKGNYGKATVHLKADGSLSVTDTAELLEYKKENGVWVLTFVNHKENKENEPIVNNPLMKGGCRPEYAYDNTITTRNGFRQSSKDKLSKITVLYKDECVRTYTFCYGEDFYGRAQLREISQWGSEDSAAAYTHTLDYYMDAADSNKERRHPFADKFAEFTSLNTDATDSPNQRIAKKIRNFFMKDFTTPSVLGGSRTWNIGINSGGDIGLFPAFPLKTLSAGLYINASYSTSKGKTTLIDIDGDGLPDRVYNVLDGVKNKTYYCLQKPDKQGFETTPKLLSGIDLFLEDASDNASIGLQGTAGFHGGIQKGWLGDSWTSVYFADMDGDGLVDVVGHKSVKKIGVHQRPPTFKFGDCLFPQITTTEDSISVRCDTNFSFTPEAYERDRTQELRYDIVRVWEADLDRTKLKDLTYSICAPVHLAYDSISLENFCGLPDGVITSIEYYGTGLTNGSLQHILLWSDEIQDSDTTEHGPAYCTLKEHEDEPCSMMLRKTNHVGEPLGNVLFQLDNGIELVTNGRDGYTPPFGEELNEGECINIREIVPLQHCKPSQYGITICKEANCEVNAYDANGKNLVSKEIINGQTVQVITVTNDCYQQPMCYAMLRKVDQNGSPLANVQFQMGQGSVAKGTIVTTDRQGLTPILSIFQGTCIDVIELTSTGCTPLPNPITICTDAKCNVSISPYTFTDTLQVINGMLVHVITVVNSCTNTPASLCEFMLRKVDQNGNMYPNVQFQAKGSVINGIVVTTDPQGFTPILNMNQNDCVDMYELTPPVGCTPLSTPVTICTDAQCNVKVNPPIFTVTQQAINGVPVNVITVFNQCNTIVTLTKTGSGSIDGTSSISSISKGAGISGWVNSAYNLDSLPLNKGDLIFFRVRPQNNGVKKKVVWDPAVLPNAKALSRTNYLDENGKILGGGNKASESQLLHSPLLHNDTLFFCPTKGRITIESVINSFPKQTDDIRFEIWKDKQQLYSYTLKAGQTIPTPQNSTAILDVDSSTILSFKVLSSSNINMDEIRWYPRVYYLYIVDYDGSTIETVVKDDDSNDVRMFEYVIAPYHEFYHHTSTFSGCYNLYNALIPTNTVVNHTVEGLTANFTSTGLSGNLYFTIKQNGKLQFSQKVPFATNNNTLSYSLSLNDPVQWENDPNLPVYMSCYVDDPAVANKIQNASITIDKKVYSCMVYTKRKPYVLFGSMYGGWGQFLYQTDPIPNTDYKDPKAMMDINKINRINNITFNTIGSLVDTFSMGDTIAKVKDFATSDEYKKRMDDIRTSLFCLPMTNDPDNRGHQGFYANSFIRGADINLGGIPCPNFNEAEEDEPCEATQESQAPPSPPKGGENALPFGEGWGGASQTASPNLSKGGGIALPKGGGQSPTGSGQNELVLANVFANMDSKKTSKTIDNTSYTFGLSLPGLNMGHSESSSTIVQQNDIMDLNGDGIPDIIRHDKGVFYSVPQVARWDNGKSYETLFGKAHHQTTSNSYGFSFTADPQGFISMAKNSNKGDIVPIKASGKGSKLPDVNIPIGGSETKAIDQTEQTLLDINGDGLPDKIYYNEKEGATVALNRGYSFEPDRESWSLGDIGKTTSDAYSGAGISVSGGIDLKDWAGGSCSYSGGLNGTKSYSQSKEMLADINGDGLPDKIEVFPEIIYIYYNTGCGYNKYYDSIDLSKIPNSKLKYFDCWNTTQSKSANLGITLGFPIVWFAKISLSGGVDASFSMSSSNIQFMDLDGDGYADLLFSSHDTLAVLYSNLGRTGLLKTVTNPLGGTYELAYHKTPATVFHSRKWVMDTVKINDQLPGDGIDETMTTYKYDTGYYDRTEKAFYGFAKVTETHHNTALSGNPPYRTTTRYYFNDTWYKKGLQIAEGIHDSAGHPYIQTVNFYKPQALAARGGNMYVMLDSTVTCYFEGEQQAKIRQVQGYTYETTYGNVIQKTESSTDMPKVVANITYHADKGNYRVSIPKTVEIPKDANSNYRKRTTSVDNLGRMTEIRDYLDATNYLAAKMTYDDYGNVTRIVYPSHSYSYIYDDSVHAYPITVRDTFGFESHVKDYDFRFGIPLTVKDKSGNYMLYTLDQFGRIQTITSPKEITYYTWQYTDPLTGETTYGEDKNETPNPYTIKYTYYMGNLKDTVPFAAFTQHFDAANPGNDIETYTYCDGLGRIVQTKRDAQIGCGDPNREESMVTSGKVYYDAFGRKIATKYPTVECKTYTVIRDTTYFCVNHPNGGKDCAVYGNPNYKTSQYGKVTFTKTVLTDNLAWSNVEDAVAPSTSTYDIMDRPRVQTAPDNTTVNYIYGFGNDGREHTLFNTSVTDQNGHTSVSLANVNKQQYYVQPAGHQPVRFEYNTIGDLLKVEGVDFSRSYSYDDLGRKTQYKEDSLQEIYTYSGTNLTKKVLSWYENGQTQDKTLNYMYKHNRLDSVKSSEYVQPIRYIYNTKNGKLDTIKDYSGIQCFKYGKMGEITKQTRIYTLPSMANSIALSTAFQYDSWGRILNMTYPDGEKLTYEYDYGGQLKSMKGVKDNMQYEYIKSIDYNKFGAKTRFVYGNNLTTDYYYNPLNLRLDTVWTYKEEDYSQMIYKYDAIGNITSITENYFSPAVPIPMSTKHEFEYDSASQLVYANESKQNLYKLNINYLNYGRIDNYNLQNKSSKTQSNNVYTNQSNTFATDQSLDNITVNGNSHSTAVDYVYGINGALRRMHVHQTENGQPQDEFYLVDAFNNMKVYSDNGEVYGYYGYDDAGQRMYKMTFTVDENWSNTLGGKVLQVDKIMTYPNGYLNFDQHGNYTKHYYADATRIASKIGSGFRDSINIATVTDTMPLFTMKKELGEVVIPKEVIVDVICPFPQITHLQGDSFKYEKDLYFHHGNHLSSNQLVSDIDANIVQQIHYDPWGNVVLEHNQNWQQDIIPNFTYQAKIADSESGLIYFESRYYAPKRGVFTRRDDLFEKFYYLSPYSSMGNNWVNMIDPTGEAWEPTTNENTGENTGYRWIAPAQSYNKDGSLKAGLYEQAIFFSSNGSGNNIGSSTATVYAADGTTSTFDACTNPSNSNSYATVPAGIYQATVGTHNGTTESYPALKMSDVGGGGRVELGQVNPAYDDGRTYATGIDIHKAGRDNYTGEYWSSKLGRMAGVSEGCLLIDKNRWGEFIGMFNNSEQKSNTISVTVSRTMSAPTNQNIGRNSTIRPSSYPIHEADALKLRTRY